MDQRSRKYVDLFVTFAVMQGVLSCTGVSCPSGTRQENDRCIAPGDAAIATGDITETPASAGNGAHTPDADAPSSAAETGSAGLAAMSAAGASAPAAGASADPAGQATPAMSGAEMTIDPCAGRAESIGCEGATLVRCDANGTIASRETCETPALCQIGVAIGACASCVPGTHRCTGADLELCGADGKYTVVKTCETVALCSASAGDCTTKVCAPEATVCDATGMLQTCNADGTQIIATADCEPSLCDAEQGRCNSCVPSTKSCDGDQVVECAADGQTEAVVPCGPADECHTSTCMLGKCVSLPKALGASCASAKLCDGEGNCVGCLTDRDCGANELCRDQMCVVKACTPNAATCTASGTLQVCDSTGLRVETTMQCGQRRCNEAGRACYACVPNEATCSGQIARKCAADGSGTTEMRCVAEGECTTAVCTSGVCGTRPTARGTRCSAGKCDGDGRCVTCLDGETTSCTDVPRDHCGPGSRTCRNNQWSACSGAVQCPSGQTCSTGSCQPPEECGDGIVSGDEECDSPNDQYSCDRSTCRLRTYYTYCADDTQCLGDSFCYENKCVMECAGSGICRDWFGVQGACFKGVCLRTCDTTPCPPTMSCVAGADDQAASLCS